MSDQVPVIIERSYVVRRTERYRMTVEASGYDMAKASTEHAIDKHFGALEEDVVAKGELLDVTEEHVDEPVTLAVVDPDDARVIAFPEGGRR